MSNTTAPSAPSVALTARDIESLPAETFDESIPGVTHRVLWRGASSTAGVMYVEAGHHLGRHRHRVNHHHLWVLDGRVDVLGDVLGPGSYVHVPAGVEHDLDATRTDGCSVFYLYIREGP